MSNSIQKIPTLIYALLCYVVSNAGLIWFIGFEENLWFEKTIDQGGEYPLFGALVVNIGLLFLFGISHSGMARESFKSWLSKYIPVYLERSTYTFTAGLILVFICWMWRPMPITIYDLEGTSLGNAMCILNFIGLAIMAISMGLIDAMELCGWRQILDHWKGENNQLGFRAPGFYQLVRHPLYLGIFIVLWSSSTLTLGHLLFSTGMTVYIFIGIHFEERDLIKSYGQDYVQYAKHTPRLLPKFG